PSQSHHFFPGSQKFCKIRNLFQSEEQSLLIFTHQKYIPGEQWFQLLMPCSLIFLFLLIPGDEAYLQNEWIYDLLALLHYCIFHTRPYLDYVPHSPSFLLCLIICEKRVCFAILSEHLF